MIKFSLISYLRKLFHAIFPQENSRHKVYITMYFPKIIMLKIKNYFCKKTYPPKYTITLTAIFKNEAFYLAEWIEYYLLIGVEHFYLYDNASDDNSTKILEPYIQKGLVTLHSYPGVKKQMSAYKHSVKHYKQETEWMIIVDIDEFIYLQKHHTLKEMLSEYKNYDAVQCRWVLFGDSGNISRPDGLVIENYVHRSSYDKTWSYKSIIKPSKLIVALNQHKFYMLGKNVLMPFESAQCNHYFCKSYEEYLCKKAARNKGQERTDADGNYKYTVYTFHHHNFNDIYDDNMLQYVVNIKKNLNTRTMLNNYKSTL